MTYSDFTSSVNFFCSSDGAELLDLYDPSIDEDIFLAEPEKNNDSISEQERIALESRRKSLLETLERIRDEEKRNRLNHIVNTQSAVIMVCPICKRVYDSRSIFMQEKTHGDDNSLPYRKPKQHQVVSDDKESIERATSDSASGFGFHKEIFFSDIRRKNVERENSSYSRDNRTLFKQKRDFTNMDNIKHAATELKLLQEKFGEDNIDIQIYLPD